VPCSPGEVYYIEAQTKRTVDGSGHQHGVQIEFFNAAGTSLLSADNRVASTTWTKVALSLTAPAAAVRVQFTYWAHTNVVAQFDAIYARRAVDAAALIVGSPSIRVSRATSQSFTNTVTATMLYTTVSEDTDSAYSTGTGRFTVPANKGGYYLIFATVAWNAAFSFSTNIYVWVNNTAVRFFKGSPNGSGGQYDSLAVTGLLLLSAGDTVEIQATQNSGIAQNTVADGFANYFVMRRIA